MVKQGTISESGVFKVHSHDYGSEAADEYYIFFIVLVRVSSTGPSLGK